MSWILLHFSRTGAAAYLSHLDTARALRRTFARAGLELALTKGMRPKPRLSLGLPLPVGAEALDELAAAELVGDEDLASRGELPRRLRTAAPEGLVPLAVEVCDARPRLQPLRAEYECLVPIDVERARAVAEEFRGSAQLSVERRSPKGLRQVELKRFAELLDVRPDARGSWISLAIMHRRDGAARPDEVAAAVCGLAGSEPAVLALKRTRVVYTGLPASRGCRESEKT